FLILVELEFHRHPPYELAPIAADRTATVPSTYRLVDNRRRGKERALAGLKGRYCIVGIGETTYSRHSGRSTRSLGTEAVRRAMHDAGLQPWEIDGMLNYHVGDSTLSQTIAGDLGIRLDFYTDTFGGGASTEVIVGLAMGAIEAGMCHTVAIYRSMNGYSQLRQGGSTGGIRPPATVVTGPELDTLPYGVSSPAQNFQLT